MNRRLLLLLLLALPLRADGPLAVVVNPQCPLQTLTRQQTADLFLGTAKRLPSGEVALPIEQVLPEEIRSQFYLRLTRLSLPSIRSRWARILFSGQGRPPSQATSGAALLDLVATHRNAVGFLEQSQVTDRVKVVLILE